ncbi:hypothetical protein HOD29_02690 [archaeon]|jgi:hypothetical protein|nr:hypothetical protein [archaeon]
MTDQQKLEKLAEYGARYLRFQLKLIAGLIKSKNKNIIENPKLFKRKRDLEIIKEQIETYRWRHKECVELGIDLKKIEVSEEILEKYE